MRPTRIGIWMSDSNGHGPKQTIVELGIHMSASECVKKIKESIQFKLNEYKDWWIVDNKKRQGEMF